MVALALAPLTFIVAIVTIGNRKYQFHHVCVFRRVLCGVWCVQTPRLRHHKLVTRWCVCVCATLCVGWYYTIDTTPYIICYLLFAIIVNKQRATSDGKAHTCSASNEIPLSIHTTRATAHTHVWLNYAVISSLNRVLSTVRNVWYAYAMSSRVKIIMKICRRYAAAIRIHKWILSTIDDIPTITQQVENTKILICGTSAVEIMVEMV